MLHLTICSGNLFVAVSLFTYAAFHEYFCWASWKEWNKKNMKIKLMNDDIQHMPVVVRTGDNRIGMLRDFGSHTAVE